MGDEFIVRRGGGKLEFLAALIEVTYPKGSTCTCTNTETGKAFTGKDMSSESDAKSRALFNVEPGTWTVSCTDGTKSKTNELTVEEGKTYSVTLNYEVVLFDKDKGIDRTDLTGGWSKYRDGYIGYNDNNDSSGGRGCMCKTAINMSQYTKLVFKTGEIKYAVSAQGGLSSSYEGNSYVSLSPKVSLNSNTTHSLDISSVNNACYIGFSTGIHGSYYAVDQILVSYVHLE